MFDDFRSQKLIAGTKQFLDSNSIIAKFAFLLLVIIVFIILLQAGIYIMSWLFSPSEDPILLKCMHPAKMAKTIYSDPNLAGSGATVAPILRSKNDRFGLEYTWATWLFVDPSSFSSKPKTAEPMKHVFSKTVTGPSGAARWAESSDDNAGMLYSNAPGVYLQNVPNEQFEGTTSGGAGIVNMIIVTRVIGSATPSKIVIEDIPLSKWVHVVIRVTKQLQLDVYINGSLRKRMMLSNVVEQNQGNVLVCYGASNRDSGWDGYISDLRYYNYALGTNAIMSLTQAGPNMSACSDSDLRTSQPPYLSTRWYFSDANDMYNP